jgi:hypothetical protein
VSTHQRSHLEQLMVTRRPIVQQDEAEDVLFCIFDVEPFSPRDRFGEEVAHLELEV